ncbi:MAG: hypothetical protein RLZZ584_4258 [Pseudomonadota bacterium]|jgi:hypothetical protein
MKPALTHRTANYCSGRVGPFRDVIWLGDLPLAVIKQTRTGSGTTLNVATRVDYIYADHLDTPRVIVNSGDHVPFWRWDNSRALLHTPPSAPRSQARPH